MRIVLAVEIVTELRDFEITHHENSLRQTREERSCKVGWIGVLAKVSELQLHFA